MLIHRAPPSPQHHHPPRQHHALVRPTSTADIDIVVLDFPIVFPIGVMVAREAEGIR